MFLIFVSASSKQKKKRYIKKKKRKREREREIRWNLKDDLIFTVETQLLVNHKQTTS